jgi:ATP-binding cassette subfamily B protein
MPDHASQLRGTLRPDEELLLLTETDIDRSGRFGRRWLAVTSERLMVFPDELSDGAEVEVPLESVQRVAAKHMVGHLALEAEADGRRIVLLHCTNSLSEKFGRVARALTRARKDGKRPQFDLGAEQERVCPHCGRLLPEKGSFCPACLKKTEVIARLWAYMRPHWPKMLLMSGIVTITTGLGLAPPYLTKILVDDVLLGPGGAGALLVLIIALAGTRAVGAGLEIVQGRMSAWLGSRIIHDVRFDLYQAIQRLALHRHDRTQTGGLLSRLTGDTTMLNFFFMDIGIWFLPETLRMVGTCVVLFSMCWWLALLVMVPIPALILITVYLYGRAHRLYHRAWQTRARMSAQAADTISGIRVVKAFSREPLEIDKFSHRSAEFYRAAATAESMWATAHPIMMFVMGSGSLLVWYFGGLGVLRDPDKLTVGTLTAFLAYIWGFYGPVQMLTRLADWANRARPSRPCRT